MRDGFLFNDDNAKQRGVGCDALCPDDKRLKYKWSWSRYEDKKAKPNQLSYAELENNWELETVFWHTYYEARVKYVGETIVSHNADGGDHPFHEGIPLLTRLDAQIKAEELFLEFAKKLAKQCGLMTQS